MSRLLSIFTFLSPVFIFVRSPVDTLFRSPVDTLFRSPVDTLFRSPVDTFPALSLVAGVCEGEGFDATDLFFEAVDWLPPLIDLFDVPVLVEGVRACVVAGRFCVEAELFWVVAGRLIPPPPPLLPPDIRCASIIKGNSIIVATRNNPEMKSFEVILVFINRKF